MSSSADSDLPAVDRYVVTWERAVQRFRDDCQIDPIVELEGLQVNEIVPSVCIAQSQRFKAFQERADRLQDAVTKLLEVIRGMTDVLEAKLFVQYEELSKPYRVMVCVLATLLRAGGGNGAQQEAIIELIEHLENVLSYLPSDPIANTALDQSLIQILVEFISIIAHSLRNLRHKSSRSIPKGFPTQDKTTIKHFQMTEMLIQDAQWTQNPFPLLFKTEWKKAIDVYKQNTGMDPNSATWPSTNTPEKVLTLVSSSEAVFKRSDMERSRLRILLRAVLDKMRVMVDGLPEDSRKECGIERIAFGSTSTLIMACREKKAAFEVVTNTLKAIESRLPRLNTADGYLGDNTKAVAARVLIQTITVFGLTAKLLKDNHRFLATLSLLNVAERRSTQNAPLSRALDDLSNLAQKVPVKSPEPSAKPLASIWEKAVEKYIADTNSDYSFLQSLGGIGSLDDLKHDVEMRRIEFKRCKEVDGEFREIMQPIFGCLAHLLGVVTEGMSMMIQPAGIISGAMKLLFEAANSVESTDETILCLFEQLSSYLNRLGVHGPNDIPPELLAIYVEILAQFLTILGLVTRAVREGRFVRFLNFAIGGVDEVQTAMKKLNGLLDSEQRMTITLVLRASQTPQSALPAPKSDVYIPPYVIPPPPLCIGRDAEMAKITDLILAFKSVVILGGGGMGKTTVALAVLHQTRIANQFSTRYFIDCEGITTLALLLGRIADALRIPAASRDEYLSDRLIDALRGKNIVVCLDNFESLWETDSKVTVEAWLKSLIALVELVVLITMRGAERPSGVMHYHVLSPPDFRYALRIFEEISGCADEFARQLVLAVDCLPLAVSLLAHQVSPETETTNSLWKRWEKRGTAVVSRSDTERHRLLNLECSIELSLDSPRVQADPNARTVLAILAILPDGLANPSYIAEELGSCVPNLANLSSSLTTLTRSALAYIDQSGSNRFRVLNPIGQYVRARHSAFINPEILDACVRVYAEFIRERYDYTNPQLHKEVPMELINIHGVLDHALNSALSTDGRTADYILLAVRRQAEWSMYLGTASIDILQKVQLLAFVPPDILGDCLNCLGEIYVRLDRIQEAESLLLRAVELHQQSQTRLGEGKGSLELGKLYMRLDRLEEAGLWLLRAVELYQETRDRMGEGSGSLELGQLYMRLDRLEEAELSLLRAVDLYQQIHDRLGEGNCQLDLGELYMRLDRLEESESMLLRAVELFQQTHDRLGEGGGSLGLGRIYMRLDRLEEAETLLLRAVELCQQAHSSWGEGDARSPLGDLYTRLNRLDEAESQLLRALDLHQQAHVLHDEGYDRGRLGELYMHQDRLKEAEVSLLQAVKIHQQSHHRLGEGNDRSLLGELYMRQDRLSEAKTSLLAAVELHQHAYSAIGEGDDRLRLGQLYLRQERLCDAEAEANLAIKLYEGSQSQSGSESAQTLLSDVRRKIAQESEHRQDP